MSDFVESSTGFPAPHKDVVYYARCPGETPDFDMSAEVSLDIARRYIEEQGWELVGHYVARGPSGLLDDRQPALGQLA